MKPQLINIALENKGTIRIKKVDQFHLNSPFHFHQLCELVWIEKGSGKRLIGDRVENFSDGDLVLMSPNLPHIWQNEVVFPGRKRKCRTKATVVYFPPDFIRKLSDEPSITQPVEHLIQKASRGIRFFGNTHENVTRILSHISPEDGLKKILSFLTVADMLSESKEYEYIASVTYRNCNDEKDIRRFNDVYRFLMQNFRRQISLEEVAAICYMAPTAFCRYFKSRTGKTFTGFLNEIRIGHACKLLQDKNNSVADSCYNSGYNNLTSFNKLFKVINKKTPSHYRKHYKELEV
jgi:AraC-like DNA-binding protein